MQNSDVAHHATRIVSGLIISEAKADRHAGVQQLQPWMWGALRKSLTRSAMQTSQSNRKQVQLTICC